MDATLVLKRINSTITLLTGIAGYLLVQLGVVSEKTITQLIESLQWAYDRIKEGVSINFEPVLDAIDRIEDMIIDTIDNEIEAVTKTISKVETRIQSRIDEGIQSVTKTIADATGKVISNIDQKIGTVTKTVTNATSKIIDNIEAGIESTIKTVEDTAGKVIGRIADVGTTVVKTAEAVKTTVTSSIANAIDDVTRVVYTIERRILGSIDEAIDSVIEFVDGVYDKIGRSLTEAKELIAAIPLGFATAIAQVFDGAAITIPEQVVDTFAVGLGAIPALNALSRAIPNLPGFFKGLLGVGVLYAMLQEMKDALFGPQLERLRQSMSGQIREGLLDTYTIAQIVRKGFLSNNKAYEILSRAGLDDEQINALFHFVDQYLPPQDLADLANKKLISIDKAVEDAKKQGFSQEDVNILLESKKQYLGISDLVNAHLKYGLSLDYVKFVAQRYGFTEESVDILTTLQHNELDITIIREAFLRGLIDENEVNERIRRLGIWPQDVDIIKKLFIQLPSINDMIRMAVREAFTPEIAEKFGQYEDYPELLTRYAKMVGLDEEWAKRYWASHWDLPSVQMGFEMYHREVINEDELNKLMRALDIMPFWRDKILKISYNIPTRVDLRRMYELGLIDDTELERRLRHYGYSPEDAKLMLEYYRVEREYSQLAEKAEGRGLTKTEILSAYTNEMMSYDEALEALKDLHYGEEEAELFLILEEYKQSKTLRDKKIKLIKEKYINGFIDMNDAIIELGKLNLTAKEMDKTLVDFELEIIPKTKRPSETSIMTWGKMGLITPDEVANEMLALGYSKRYAELFKRQIEMEVSKGAK